MNYQEGFRRYKKNTVEEVKKFTLDVDVLIDSFWLILLLNVYFLYQLSPYEKKTILIFFLADFRPVGHGQISGASLMLNKTKTGATEAQQERLAKWNLVSRD